MSTRRQFWAAAAVAAMLALTVTCYVWSQIKGEGDDFRVTLLGTGSPQPTLDRFGPYHGPLVAGEDLMVFRIGPQGVTASR